MLHANLITRGIDPPPEQPPHPPPDPLYPPRPTLTVPEGSSLRRRRWHIICGQLRFRATIGAVHKLDAPRAAELTRRRRATEGGRRRTTEAGAGSVMRGRGGGRGERASRRTGSLQSSYADAWPSREAGYHVREHHVESYQRHAINISAGVLSRLDGLGTKYRDRWEEYGVHMAALESYWMLVDCG